MIKDFGMVAMAINNHYDFTRGIVTSKRTVSRLGSESF